MASAGWRKNDGVPVEASVALILRQTMPDLPRPMVTTPPLQALISWTTPTNVPSRCSIRPRMAAASTSRTRLASARAGCTGLRMLSKVPTRLRFLRQQHGQHAVADRRLYAGRARQARHGAELRVELRGLALHDVALQRRRGLGRQTVVARQRDRK